MNKTENNLKRTWKQLDNASGELYNALDNLSSMSNLPDEMKRQIEMIDITRIDVLKNEVEELINKKGGSIY